jgi:hypothetical protein
VVAWVSRASLLVPESLPAPSTWITLGPDSLRTGVLALGWGVFAGAVGAAVPDRVGRAVP